MQDMIGGEGIRGLSRPPGTVVVGEPPFRDETRPRELSSPGKPAPDVIAQSPTEKPGNPQRQLNEYREKLFRQMESRDPEPRGERLPNQGRVRVSPIQEESSPSPRGQPFAPDPLDTSTTPSTESGKTVRGAATPASLPLATPSYPFPRMASSPSVSSAAGPRSSTAPSPAPLSEAFRRPSAGFRAQDTLASTSSTPTVSNMTFLPPGCQQTVPDHHDYPSPNIYELTLMLSAEPGLEAWWNAVVQIMVDMYKAERVTLAVPADPTDIENVPWSLKATYNARPHDDMSLGYLARGSSFVPSSTDEIPSEGLPQVDTSGSTPQQNPQRAPLQSRHSFTVYEKSQRTTSDEPPPVLPRAALHRPHPLTRSKSIPIRDNSFNDHHNPSVLNQEALEQHDKTLGVDQDIPSWEMPFMTPREGRGQVLQVLRPLSDEADPLIDHNGVLRILERGRVVALTRTYPYLNTPEPGTKRPLDDRAGDPARAKTKMPRADSLTKLSSFLGGATASSIPTHISKAQAPERKPTLASRIDDEPPKLTTPKYEEYEQAPPSPWSQSPAPTPAARADPAENPFFTDAMVDEESFNPSSAPPDYSAMAPAEAIGVDNSWTVLHVPLTHVLLSKPNPSFRLDPSLMELKMSNRKVANHAPLVSPSPGHPVKDKHAPVAILSILSSTIPYPSNLRHSLEHLAPHLATTFSLARHYTHLETELNGLKRNRPPSRSLLADPTVLTSMPMSPPAEIVASLTSFADSVTSPSECSAPSGPSRSATDSPFGTPNREPPSSSGFVFDQRATAMSPSPNTADDYFSPAIDPGHQQRRRDSQEAAAPAATQRSSSLDQASGERTDSLVTREETLRKRAGSVGSTQTARGHTKLHSYGADFTSTFQSLPPSSTIARAPHAAVPSTRPTSAPHAGMIPPSDRLKGLILDSLPAHVFVALPPTGEIVWVNSRFLSYRGQTSSDLAADPWGSIHPDDRDDYLRAWTQSVRTGEQFSRTVRIRRFDGAYRWFYARAVASKDKRGVIMQFLGSYMDIHDQHVAELKAARQEEIMASEAKHRLLANLIPQIIFTATEDEGITFANDQWLSYTGQDFDSALGLGFMDYVHPDDLAKCRIPLGLRQTGDVASPSVPSTPSPNLGELAKHGVIKASTDSSGRLSYTTEIRLRSKSDEYRWHLVRCVEIDNVDFGNGESSYFGSATDINDLKLLEAKLKEAMDSKGRFLSNMSHEIRTPLIGITGMVSFLQGTILTEEQRDYTNTIQTSANSLLMIINDILDLSKVDAGMMKLNHEWFHTRSLIEDVNELVSTMAIAKRLELNYVVEEDVPSWVKGDKVRIRQVLLNVIGNAIKFTSQGEVFSRCRVVTPEGVQLRSDKIMLEFSVVDTGRGFTKKEAELIFKPFSQIDGSSTRQHGGSGLGLVISRQLVELHGGTMVGTAVPGKGSTFTFTAKFGLPTEDDHPDATTAPQPTPGLPRDIPLPVQAPPLMKSQGSLTTIDADHAVSVTGPSSVGSDLSESSGQSGLTCCSSVSSAKAAGLIRFSQAARASGQDSSQLMKLDLSQLPRVGLEVTVPEAPASTSQGVDADTRKQYPRPPMYSILIICTQTLSREAITKHIEMTLPKSVPHQITSVSTVDEAYPFLCGGGGNEHVRFTHIVINLPSDEEIVTLVEKIAGPTSQLGPNTRILILSDSVQRQAVAKLVSGTPREALFADGKVTYIYKPVKPSRLAVIFDPARERDLSIDLNRSSAQRIVEDQRRSYLDLAKRLGGKGHRVLLVEDNPVNQKVLLKYLQRVGLEVEVAADGVECTDMVFEKGDRGYYSLILCDLHMPRKDGYQACREVRAWEASYKGESRPPLPIIALSANVMSDVQERCAEAGFSDYLTKPVDFIDLSRALAKFF
ncbi:hypothetical protein VTJ49DRAFT_7477 [Mycothermus thermophilus]|uniref:histidine kinase n=1 Tax=Humicola insolens TaxID=85995 RepID=A0ABR3VHX6_HUMIN